jgi:hypothetical protein
LGRYGILGNQKSTFEGEGYTRRNYLMATKKKATKKAAKKKKR